MFTSVRCISRHEKTQVYGAILSKELTNQAMLESKAYKTYYAFASREKTPKPKYVRKKVDSNISPKPKQKPVQATKGTRLKTKTKVAKSNKKKQPAKKPKAKGLAVLSKVALTEAEQLKLATKRSKKDFHISHASGSGYGVDTQSKVLDEQHFMTTGADKETGIIPGVFDVPIYVFESEKESWGDGGEEDEDDESDFVDKVIDDNNDGSSDDHDVDSDDERTESDGDEIHDPNLTNVDQTKHEEEDVDERKTGGPTQSSSVSSDFTSKLLNFDNPSPADNEIASLMDTTAHHATTIPEITSSFTTTIPSPPPFLNPLSQQATPTPTPTASETTTSLPALLDFASVFKFNERVTNLEKDLSEIKQVDQTIIKEEVKAQLPQILPQAISDVATPIIEKNVTESLEAAILTRSSSQP
nr:hypothetical protein [Tanacetum cinerariifolium]